MRSAIGAFEPFEAAPTIDDLVSAGFGRSGISVVAHEATQQSHAFEGLGSHIEGLHEMLLADIGRVTAAGPFAARIEGARAAESLREAGLSDRITERYVDIVQHGGALIVADVPDDKIDEAVSIMSRHLARPPTTSPEPTGGRDRAGVATFPVIEEQLQVGKREVERGGVRVRSEVSERPVTEQVNLREEKVDVSRRPTDRPIQPSDEGAFRERTVEVTERSEEPVVAKTARVVEEVEVKKETGTRSVPVEGTVRRQDVVVEPLGKEAAKEAQTSGEVREAEPGSTGAPDFGPAYRYGDELARRQGAADWASVEAGARREWEAKNPDSPWEKFAAAVKHAWHRAIGDRKEE